MKRRILMVLLLALLLTAFSAWGQSAQAEAPSAESQRGAKTLKQLNMLLTAEQLFTPEQVNCMSWEMLMGCLTSCDPENGLAMLEDYDPEAIAAFLNERFFDTVELERFRYNILRQYNAPVQEEIVRETLAWFESQKESVSAQYGEENYLRIHEETAGQQEYIMSDYTMCFADGRVKKDGYAQGNTNGLTIIKSYDRYYWTAFDLFTALEETIEIQSPLAGTVKEGYYFPAKLGIRFRLEDWEAADRESMAQILYGDAAFASATPEEIMDQGRSYGDLMIQKGYSTAYFLLLKLPVQMDKGDAAENLQAYMDSSEKELAKTFSRGGMRLISLDRSETELGGRSFEMIRVHANGGIDQYFTLLATEEEGVLLLVNINSLVNDDTDEILSLFEPLGSDNPSVIRLA